MNKTNLKKYRYLIIASILLVVLIIISFPVRNFLSSKHVAKGDNYLIQKKFVSAKLEYNKAKILSDSKETDSRIAKARQAETDISVLEQDFKENNLKKDADNIKLAKQVPEDESKAVTQAKEFVGSGDYQLAILCAKTAIEMDQSYRDAWIYLGIANLSGANDKEVSKESKLAFEQAAREAFARAEAIDPGNETVKKYLSTF